MASSHARIVRGAACAVVVFFLAAGAHLAGGAALPSPIILGTLAITTLLAATIVSQRKLSLPAVFGVLSAGQLLLHEAFTMLTTTAACVPAARGHFGPQQVHCAPTGGFEHAHAFSLFDSPLMFAAHAGAVVVTALMLYHGEAAVELAVQWLRPLPRLPRLRAVLPLADLPPVPETPARNYLAPLLSNRPLRGPPLPASL